MESLASLAARVKPGSVPPPNAEERQAREQFKSELEHLAAAYRHELMDETIRVYWRALKDIPVEIRTAGLTKCLQTLKFFPAVAEILNACADVVDARRKVLAAEAARLKEDCELRKQGQCNGVHRETHNGVTRCECHKVSVERMALAPTAIQRPALPPPSDPEAA